MPSALPQRTLGHSSLDMVFPVHRRSTTNLLRTYAKLEHLRRGGRELHKDGVSLDTDQGTENRLCLLCLDGSW